MQTDRTIVRRGEEWFVAMDQARALGYRDASQAVRVLDSSMVAKAIVYTDGGPQEMLVISREGADLLKAKRRPIGQRGMGWIYYLGVGSLIKIGYATNLRRRVLTYPPDAELLAAHRDHFAEEQRIHDALAADTFGRREWYRKTESVMEAVSSALALGQTDEARALISGHQAQTELVMVAR